MSRRRSGARSGAKPVRPPVASRTQGDADTRGVAPPAPPTAAVVRRRRIVRFLGIAQPLAYLIAFLVWLNDLLPTAATIALAAVFVGTVLLRLYLSWRWRM